MNPYLEALRAKKAGMSIRGELTKLPKPPFVSFGSLPPTRIPEIEASNDPGLRDLLAQHGGFHGVDWHGLALIDAQESNLWLVRRLDGLLTLLATVQPISKPTSYRQAWPARFTSPEPDDDAAPAVQAAQAVIERARQSCWDCRHLGTHQRPTCALRHPVAWQTARALTYPRRFDRLDCGDQTP